MEHEKYTLSKYVEVIQEKVCTNIEWKIIDLLALFEEHFTEICTDLFSVHEECDCGQFRHPKNIRLKIKKRGQQIAVFFLCVPIVPITSEAIYYNSSSLFSLSSATRQTEHFQPGWQFLDVLSINTGVSSHTDSDKTLKITLKLKVSGKSPDPDKTIYYIFHEPVAEILNECQNMLKEGTYSDVTLLSKAGESVKAHKEILAKRSEMFRAMFKHDKTKPETEIPTALDEKTLGEMVTWIYTEKTPKCDDITVDLFVASDYYQLHNLKTICARALFSQLTVENAIATLELAERHNCKNLLNLTLQYIKNGLYDLVIKTKGFKNIQSVNTLKLICKAASENENQFDSQKIKEKIENQYILDICLKKGNVVNLP